MGEEGNELRGQFEEEASRTLAPKQFEYVCAYRRLKSISAVAREFGVIADTIKGSLKVASQKLGLAHFHHLIDTETHIEYKQKKGLRSALLELLELQHRRCALSGYKLTPATAVVDHKVPISEGGSSDIENLQWLHCDVNRAKGTLNNEEFIDLCKRISDGHRTSHPGPG